MRFTTPVLVAAAMAFGLAEGSVAYAQAGAARSRGAPSRQQASSSKVVDGVTYSFDAAGNPLYKDDPVNYNPPRRFYYRNGNWVMEQTSGRGGGRYMNSAGSNGRGRNGQSMGSRRGLQMQNVQSGQNVRNGQTLQTGQANQAGRSKQTGNVGAPTKSAPAAARARKANREKAAETGAVGTNHGSGGKGARSGNARSGRSGKPH